MGLDLYTVETDPPDGSIIPLNPIITIKPTFWGMVDIDNSVVAKCVLKKTSTGEIITPSSSYCESVLYVYDLWPQINTMPIIVKGYKNLALYSGYDLYYEDRLVSHFTIGTAEPPDASFMADPVSGPAPLTVQFTDCSWGGGVPIVSWSWDFGDSTDGTSTQQNPSHTYKKPGSYYVSLTVRNANGLKDSLFLQEFITVGTPTLVGALDAPALVWTTDLDTPWTVDDSTTHDGQWAARSSQLFQNSKSSRLSTSIAGPATVSFWWKVSSHPSDRLRLLVDGDEITAINGEVDWTEYQLLLPSGTHALTWEYLTDSEQVFGQSRGWLDQVTVTDTPPTALFTATPTSGTAPLAVQFTDTSTGSPTSWSWTFGDGTTSTLRNPSHTYNAAGTYTVSLTVRNAAGQSDTETRAGMISVLSAPTPTVAGISPASAARGATGTYTVTGTNFVAGAEVAVQGGTAGTTTVYATGETVLSATQVRCTLAIPTNAYPGPYTVFVRNPGGGWISKAGAFTVTPPTPTVTGISPASAARGATGTCTVTGTNFVAGAEVAVKGGTGGTTTVYATGETVLSATQVRCTLAIPTNAYPGPYTVFVRNPGGGWISKAGAFTVTPPTPTVTGISPASAARGATGTCTVTGTNFVAGAEVAVKGGTGGTTTVYATGETVLSATQVRCTLAIPTNAYPGPYTVFVRNPGGGWISKAGAFTVTPPTPTVTGISPASAARGATGTCTVTGTNFVAGAEVAVKGGTGGTTTVYATGETVLSATQVRCTLAIPTNAYPGPYTVFVRNPGGGWISKAGAFTVTSPAPTVTAIAPA